MLAIATTVVVGCDTRAVDAVSLADLAPPSEGPARDAHVAYETAVAKPAFSGIVLDHAMMTIAGVRAAVSGTLDMRTNAIDLVARFGDMVATVRGTGAVARACVTKHMREATLVACGSVPASIGALGSLKTLEVTWQLAAREWRGHGTATIAWRDGELVADRGHADLVITAGQLAHATASAELHGPVSKLALVGDARMSVMEVRDGVIGATLHDLAMPFAVRLEGDAGKLVVRAAVPLVARGRHATLHLASTTMAVDRPAITVARVGEAVNWTWPRRLDWSADEATWHDVTISSPSGTIDNVDTITWTGLSGVGPIDGTSGALTFKTGPLRVARGWVAIAGGLATVEPFVVTGTAQDVVLHLASIELDPVLRVLGRGRVEGTGMLDGRLVLRLDGADSSIVSGALSSHRGAIRVADAAWRARLAAAAGGGMAVDKRIYGALGDFEYAGLVADLGGTRGPELKINMHGQGKRVPQQLDLVFNVNGIRELARRMK